MAGETTQPTDSNHTGLYMQIGLNLRKARNARNMTQDDLAKRVRLSRTSVTNIEKGRQSILVHTLVNLAAVLETPISEIVPPPVNENSVEKLNPLAHLPDDRAKNFVGAFLPPHQKTKTKIIQNTLYDSPKKTHR